MSLREQLQESLGAAYTLERELGGGGMSRVFVADETRLKRKVVVKVLSPELAAGLSAERFEREIQLAASLQQANIVPVLSAGDMGGLPYYTMPLVDGESLRARLGSGALPVTTTLNILRDVAKALAYAHERGVVHRDIKPDNVLISGGTAVVTDFGIAKAISASRTDSGVATLTQLGTSIGTPAYMAPEQAAGDPDVDHRADLYAFGCLAYELLAGRPPFTQRTPQRVLSAHLTEVPVPVGELRPDTPVALASLVMRCLAKDAIARPQSASEVVDELERVLTSGGQAAMPGVLIAPRDMLLRALGYYAAAFVVVAIVARAAIIGIGLPDWVFPGSLIVMGLGLPVILFTAYVHRATHRALTRTPSSTSHDTLANIALRASPHVSWQRTLRGGVYALSAFVLVVGAFMALRALGIGPAGSLFAAGKISSREPLLLADFAVTNADSSLGPVMTDAVRTELGQSSVIALLAPARVANALRRMERPLTAHVTPTLAREIAEREGVKAVVEGNVTAVGTGYIVTLRLVSADSGMELASFRETGEGPRGLIDAADKLARRLRGRIGESLRSVQASTPLAQATTSSLEALRKYSEAWRANTIEGNPARAIKISREAVAIDSTFASAWRLLSVVLGNTGQTGAAHDSAITRAYQYRNRLPELERLRVEAYYYLAGPHADRTKAIALHEQAIERGDPLSANNLGEIYRSRRDYARAEATYRLLIAKQPDFALAFYNAIEMALNQGKVAVAESLLTASIKIAGNVRGTTVRRVAVAYAKGGPDSARRLLDSIPNDPGLGPFFPTQRTALAILGGRLAEAKRLIAEWRPRDRTPMAALSDSTSDVSRDAWFYGPSESIAKRLDAVLARYPLKEGPVLDRPYFFVAGTFALAGRPEKAKQVIADYREQVTDTAILRRQAPELHEALGEIALAEQKPQVAVAEFRASDVDSDGFPSDECGPCIMIKLARAYDAAEQSDSAMVYYERFIETPFWVRLRRDIDPVFLAGAHKRLGELYEAKGNRAKAISHYTKFVELWKNADPELQPRVNEVKKRLARLAREEP